MTEIYDDVCINYFSERLEDIQRIAMFPEFTNLFFCGVFNKKNVPIELVLSSLPPIRSLQFSLTEEQFLHLAGIALFQYDDSKKITTIKPACIFSQSSFYPGTQDSNIEINTVSDPHAFHTAKEKNPWFVASFAEEAIALDVLRVYNRNRGATAARAYSLHIEAEDMHGVRHEIFDHQKLHQLFLQKLNSTLVDADSIGFSSNDTNLIDAVLVLVHFGIYEKVLPLMKRLRNTDFYFLFLYFLETKILNKRNLGFCGVKIEKQFKFWTLKQKKLYLKEALDLIHVLKQLSPAVFFAFGTVLGFVREPSHFIPHDNDIDIGILLPKETTPSIDSGLERIKQHLFAHNYIKIRHQKKLGFLHVDASTSPTRKIDIFLGRFDKNGDIEFFPSFWGKFLQIEDMLPPLLLDIFGMQCPIPKNPFRYLELSYGKDWRVPRNEPSHYIAIAMEKAR